MASQDEKENPLHTHVVDPMLEFGKQARNFVVAVCDISHSLCAQNVHVSRASMLSARYLQCEKPNRRGT